MKPKIFISVGTASTPVQRDAADIVFRSLETAGLNPRQMNKNEWSFEQPLRAIRNVMQECDGAVVIAFYRSSFQMGTELTKAGAESPLGLVHLTTVWNQIEAGMAYIQELPLLVIAEHGLREEGLLEGKYDWRVFWTDLGAADFQSEAFLGFLASWKDAVLERATTRSPKVGEERPDFSKLTIAQLVSGLSIPQLWKVLSAVVGVLVAVATVAFRIGSGKWPWG